MEQDNPAAPDAPQLHQRPQPPRHANPAGDAKTLHRAGGGGSGNGPPPPSCHIAHSSVGQTSCPPRAALKTHDQARVNEWNSYKCRIARLRLRARSAASCRLQKIAAYFARKRQFPRAGAPLCFFSRSAAQEREAQHARTARTASSMTQLTPNSNPRRNGAQQGATMFSQRRAIARDESTCELRIRKLLRPARKSWRAGMCGKCPRAEAGGLASESSGGYCGAHERVEWLVSLHRVHIWDMVAWRSARMALVEARGTHRRGLSEPARAREVARGSARDPLTHAHRPHHHPPDHRRRPGEHPPLRRRPARARA